MALPFSYTIPFQKSMTSHMWSFVECASPCISLGFSLCCVCKAPPMQRIFSSRRPPKSPNIFFWDMGNLQEQREWSAGVCKGRGKSMKPTSPADPASTAGPLQSWRTLHSYYTGRGFIIQLRGDPTCISKRFFEHNSSIDENAGPIMGRGEKASDPIIKKPKNPGEIFSPFFPLASHHTSSPKATLKVGGLLFLKTLGTSIGAENWHIPLCPCKPSVSFHNHMVCNHMNSSSSDTFPA